MGPSRNRKSRKISILTGLAPPRVKKESGEARRKDRDAEEFCAQPQEREGLAKKDFPPNDSRV